MPHKPRQLYIYMYIALVARLDRVKVDCWILYLYVHVQVLYK